MLQSSIGALGRLTLWCSGLLTAECGELVVESGGWWGKGIKGAYTLISILCCLLRSSVDTYVRRRKGQAKAMKHG